MVLTTAEIEQARPLVAVVFLLYRSPGVVPELVASLARQSHPGFAQQADWLEALFLDDGSADGTAETVERALAEAGNPPHWRLVVNPHNLGLAATLNRAFALARAPYVLTCHLDCRFGSDRYVASLVELIDRHPRVAAVTGKPALPAAGKMPFAEKLNVIANLMDVLPDDTPEELVPVGFAEGRCDVFRAAAMRAVGFYDTNLRVSGEDQVLAARLRRGGWAICQAPRLAYYLSVSGEQDSVAKIIRHQRLFGRTDPYILFAVPGTHQGLLTSRAGRNRRRRALLRGAQVVASPLYPAALAALAAGWGALAAIALAFVALPRVVLYRRHAAAVRLSAAEALRLALVQPLLDLAFTEGLVEGFWLLARGARSGPID
jgi:glycosyltransferase involved in cell wall biosynthesis